MRQTIRSRMILWIVLPTLLIFAIVWTAALILLQRVEERHTRARMIEGATGYARHFDLLLREASVIADTSARLLEIDPQPTEPQIFALLESNVRQRASVYGSACAFEPGAYPSSHRLYSPYVYRSGNDLKRMDINETVYDWYGDPKWQWFRKPREAQHGVWTDPYFDEGAGNALMTTYSAPFFLEGKFRGVVTIDIHLPRLQETLGGDVDPDLRFVIVTDRGQFVYSPEPKRIMNQTIFEYATELNRPDLADAARGMLAGRAGVVDIGGWDKPERQWVFFAPIPSTQWTFISRLPERIALQEARSKATALASLLTLTLLLIIGAIFFVSGRITRPLLVLRQRVLQMARGDLDARVGAAAGAGKDEIAELASSFDKMADDLRGHITKLADAQAARSTIERELDLARDIQLRLLPKTVPNIPGFDIAGWNQAAAQTGGDYFDWQPLPDGSIVISIADVSGHGLGPALVTAVCRAYARAAFSAGTEITSLVSQINQLLLEDLPEGRFVTFAAAVLDPARATILLLSAGHGPLLYYHAADDVIEEFETHGLPLAVFPMAVYGPPRPLNMLPGDFLCLVTDGFFEWQRLDETQFGKRRLIGALRSAKNLPAKDIIAAAYREVSAFVSPARQQDDLTAVIIKRAASQKVIAQS